jgi:hypothetical protein
VANGKVYVGGKTPTGGTLVVYGLRSGKNASAGSPTSKPMRD